MAVHVLHTPTITLGGQDLTDHVESVELAVGVGNVNVTPFGVSWEQHLSNDLRHWSVRVNFLQDYAASKPYAILAAAIVGTTAIPFTLKPVSTTVQSATNPTFSGVVLVDGDVNMFGGAMGDAHKFSVTLKGADTLSFLTSAT